MSLLLYRYWSSYIEGKVTELLQAESRVEQAQKVGLMYIYAIYTCYTHILCTYLYIICSYMLLVLHLYGIIIFTC